VASYRPITLLNADYKLVAKAIVLRIAAALDSVIDETQTAFVPGRWIGDNVLCHMGIIDMLSPDPVHLHHVPREPEAAPAAPATGSAASESAAHPPSAGPVPARALPACPASSACMLFLDFEKAYDRVDRGWIFACFEALGFRPLVLRWLRLLLQGTQAMVSFGGCFSRMFNVRSGAAQGSPLSPLLYVTAAQPLAAALRRLQREGIIDSIRLPGEVLAPASHQHADDTSIHTATVEGAKKALDLAVLPFCEASGSKLSISKSEGLTLGSHPPLEGHDPVTGVKFVGPRDTVKHLGVLLTKGCRAAAATAMWQKRVSSVAARVQHWRSVDLTLLGRVYVARQVMANTVTYHAQFVEPPKPQLAAIQRLIDGFVLGRPLDPGSDDRPLRGRPSATVMSLPFKEGGLGAADVALQAVAMRAKVAARLLHPQRKPWKSLARATFESAFPGVGVAALVTAMLPSSWSARLISPRLVSYWEALRRTHPHRLVLPEDMLAQQVGGEPLAGNRRVAPAAATRSALGWAAACQQWGAARRLRDLGGLTSGPVQADIPASWASKLAQAPPPTPWAVNADGHMVRFSLRGSERFFVVASDGRLVDPPEGVDPSSSSAVWLDCCVVASPIVKGRPPGAAEPLPPLRPWDPEPRADSQPSQADRPQRRDVYLVGPWAQIPVDPSLWGHGDVPLTHYCVKDATLRLKQLRAMRDLGPRYSPCEAVAPALWGPGATNGPGPGVIEAVASRHVRLFHAKVGAPQGGHRRVAVSDDQLLAIYRQPWMAPAPSRPSPADRAAQRRGLPARAQQPAPAASRDDNADALAKWDEGRPAWRQAWSDTHRKRRPRPMRVFEWQLLHDALPVGAAKAAFCPDGAANVADVVCCCHSACRPLIPPDSSPPLAWHPETLAHALIDCPAVRPALQWLAHIWVRIDGGSEPPLSPSVWLQGSTDTWQPQRADHQDLWRILRVSMLAAAWTLRTRRRATGEQFLPSQVVDACTADVRRLVYADWQLATSQCTAMSGTHSSWFPGHQPSMDGVEFERRWCVGGVIAHVSPGADGQPPVVEFRLGDAAGDLRDVGGGGSGGGGGE
jgi:hypothetical protein